MATYDNDLRLKEIATGDESGTWGTSTNTNLELISDAFGYGTKAMAADSNETFTIPDFSADPTRGMFLKITSGVSLTATRVITLGPNTVSKIWIIDNATTGGQIITIKQGSGATVNIANGDKAMVVTDGAGAGAAVFNANPSGTTGTVTSVSGTGTVSGLTLTGTVTSSGNLTLGGTLDAINLASGVTGTLPVGNGGTGATTLTGVLKGNGTGAVTASDVNLTSEVTGVLPNANGGTGQSTYAQGDLLYASAADTLAKLSLGSANQNLKVNSGGTQLEWADAGGGAELQEFTSSGTWTKPATANFVKVEVWGGGGGGEGGTYTPSPSSGGGDGGGGGGYATRMFKASDLGATAPVTIGAGGSAGPKSSSTSNTFGGTAGASYFGGAGTPYSGYVVSAGGGGGGGEAPPSPGWRPGLGGVGGFYDSTQMNNQDTAATEFYETSSPGDGPRKIWNGVIQAINAPYPGNNSPRWSFYGGGSTGGVSPPGKVSYPGWGSVYGGGGGGRGGVGNSNGGAAGDGAGSDGGSNLAVKSGGGAGGAYNTGNPGGAGDANGKGGGGGSGFQPGTGIGNGGAGGRYAGGGGGGGGSTSNAGNGGTGGAGLVRVYTW